MNVNALKSKIRNGHQPMQPDLEVVASDLMTRYVEWNPFVIKNGSLFYQFSVREKDDSKDTEIINLIPDGCPSIIFNCSDDSEAIVSGVHASSFEMELKQKSTYFVFKPHTLLGTKIGSTTQKELFNTYVDFSQLFGDTDVGSKIAEAKSFDERMEIFLNFAMKKMIQKDYYSDIPEYIAMMMCISKGNSRMSDIIDKLGYTEKYCRQRFKSEYGFSPKLYSRMMRLQYAMNEICKSAKAGRHVCMVDVMCEAGYFDQSHFIREFKEFTGITPKQCVQFWTGDKN